MLRNAIAIGLTVVSVGGLQLTLASPHAPAPRGRYIVRHGDHLDDLSNGRYGNKHYSWVVSAYNHISDEDRIAVGDTIEFPSLAEIMDRLGVDSVAAGAGARIASATDSFESHAPALREIKRHAHPFDRQRADVGHGLSGMTDLHFDCPQGVQSGLRQAAAGIDSACLALAAVGGAEHRSPALAIRGLDAASHGMKVLADGYVDDNGYDIDAVSQTLSKSIRNLVLWARNGYH